MRMLPHNSLLAGGLLIAAVILSNQGCNRTGGKSGESILTALRTSEVKQPIAFDHEAHIKAEDMDCLDCHRFADKGKYATIPRIKDCTDCHSQPQGKSPEEPKVRDYIDSGKEIPWVNVNRLPGHVYFSHQVHVNFGEMKCWDCHKDMRKESKPVTRPDIGYLTMSKCIACHKDRQVETDCSHCHK